MDAIICRAFWIDYRREVHNSGPNSLTSRLRRHYLRIYIRKGGMLTP